MAAASSPHLQTRVLKLRLKDKHASTLRAMARAVNMVWNYCNELSLKVLQREDRFISGYDLQGYLNGASKEGLGIGSAVFQQVAEEFATRRRQFKKAKLRWRVSHGARRSLGWLPFKARSLSYRGGQVLFQGLKLSLWDSYGLGSYELGAGSISEDARGRGYLNVAVSAYRWPKSQDLQVVKREAIGIDLGLKDLMADSQGGKVAAQQFYRDLEPKLAIAQRAGKEKRAKSIHAKIATRRKDCLHKLSTSQVREHRAIFVGDVNAQALTQTTMAKSVLDAGWSAFRTMLQSKCDSAGVWFAEVDEKYSTQECSCCHARSGPKGRDGLSVRSWTCSVCGDRHDRDTNAARNIRQRGLVWLEKVFAAADSRAREEPAAAVNKASGALGAMAAAGHGRPVEGIPVL